MTDTGKPGVDELIPCEICLKEIPLSASNSEEAEEYFYHYCGVDCYRQWQEQKLKENKEA